MMKKRADLLHTHVDITQYFKIKMLIYETSKENKQADINK